MKFIFNLFVLLTSFKLANSQALCPVQWSYHAEKVSENKWNIIFDATIQEHWHLYSQKKYAEDAIAPFPTAITIDSTTSAKVLDTIAKEIGDIIVKKEPLFENNTIEWYENKLQLILPIEILKYGDTVSGILEYMTCDEKQCIMGEPVEWRIIFDSTKSSTKLEKFGTKDCPAEGISEDKGSMVPLHNDYPSCNNGYSEGVISMGLFWLFLAGIGGGLLALLMPCTFPMIPMTVSFFLKRNKDRGAAIREAIIYGLSIILIYTIPAFILAKVFGGDVLNAMASSAIFNLLFFVVFIVFAFSMFGYFEINMPSWLVNKSDSMGDKGGILGIFFMALTLALVSFSCTGPVLGGLLATLTSTGNDMGLIIGFIGFGIAMAIPFAMFAIFPNMLKSLPRSGGWMTTIKVVLGLIELAFAFKFLSNVDLAYHWGFLKLELFLAIWIILAIIIALYLLDIINPFPHDVKGERVGTAVKFLATLFLLFAAYLCIGMTGKTLHLISGFPPPSYYSYFYKTAACPEGLTCYPNGLQAYKNKLEEAQLAAKEQNKPILLDFTGFSCVNCRKMEESVWTQAPVYDLIKDKYILVSLYVDDKETMPESMQYIDTISNKKISTYALRWNAMERAFVNKNAQPYYIAVDADLKKLSPPIGYTDVNTFAQFLNCGISNFEGK